MASPFGTTLRSLGLLLFAPLEAIIVSQVLAQIAGYIQDGTPLHGMFLAVGENFLFVLILSLVANVAGAAYASRSGRR